MEMDRPHLEEARQPSNVAKTAFEWNPQEKRKIGRPRHPWRCTGMLELEEGRHGREGGRGVRQQVKPQGPLCCKSPVDR